MKERLEIHITKNGLLEAVQDATGWSMEKIAALYRAQERIGRICSMVRGINSKDLKGEV